MAITTAGIGYKNTHAQRYKLVVIGSNDVDVTGWCCLGLAVIGLVNLLAGASKSTRKYKMSFNKVRWLSKCETTTLNYNGVCHIYIYSYDSIFMGLFWKSPIHWQLFATIESQMFSVNGLRTMDIICSAINSIVIWGKIERTPRDLNARWNNMTDGLLRKKP